MVPWREAMERGLYGPGGFFRRRRPAEQFRTSAQTGALARAVGVLLDRLAAALGEPGRLDVVDLGAGGGELLAALAPHADRYRLIGVELAERPAGLPAAVEWRHELPESITGLLLAAEYLDNVPVDVAEHDGATVRLVLVDPATGEESLGDPVTGRDADWLARWWPLTGSGQRAEIGHPRDDAWADAVRRVERGLAVAIDYGHLAPDRPYAATLTGYRDGRQVRPVPDGSTDVTAHVAWDSLLDKESRLVTQRAALCSLGITGGRPPLDTARTDPAGYLRALAAASRTAELTDPAGLGGHHWLLAPAGIDPDTVLECENDRYGRA